MQNILITGISGSVGHYLFDLLAGDVRYHLYLVMRRPEKLRRDLSRYSNITVLPLDLREIPKQKELLKKIDYLVWIATSWGGFREPWRVNVYPLFRTLRTLDPQRIQKIIYFSTASILNRDHKPVAAIREIGTNYIRSKFLAHKILQYNKLRDKIITFFPTWVYGGDSTHPYSHAASGLLTLHKWLKLLKYFTFDFHFHFIHCADIAKLTKYFLENPADSNEYVLGNEPLSVGDFFRQAAEYYGLHTSFQIRIPMGLLRGLAALAGKHPWDKYCLKYQNFVYEATNCRKMGLESNVDTIYGVLKSLNNA
ncbi:putative NAD-dependent epimerase/dehydratase [Candidatus Termititenax dinenymphae]|uniref:NAD-dependent epimerase/dehydratase n=1 Tax=Candidatus Termititenax dinenymphae TaxID=2218523 RepID=A0A388TJN2_9BACT|nr:putative NAD-dependent epimerase/dehydratase [Candidatus Termititenax dinenymphae]